MRRRSQASRHNDERRSDADAAGGGAPEKSGSSIVAVMVRERAGGSPQEFPEVRTEHEHADRRSREDLELAVGLRLDAQVPALLAKLQQHLVGRVARRSRLRIDGGHP